MKCFKARRILPRRKEKNVKKEDREIKQTVIRISSCASVRIMDFSLLNVAVRLTRVLVPFIIVVGVTGNALNILVLTRGTLNRHACSLYFLGLAIVNIFYCTVLLIINLLADGYQQDLSLNSSFFCKTLSFLLNFCPNVSLYLIVLASIDRFCASSISVQVRQFSNVRVARWLITFLLLCLTILFSGTLVVFDLSNNGFLLCTIDTTNVSYQVYFILVLIVYTMIGPIGMLGFGLLTIHNIHKVPTLTGRTTRFRRTEAQLTRMLLFQVGTHFILTLPFCIIFSMFVLPTSIRFSPGFYPAFVITKLPFYVSFTTAFFLYTLSAQIYRNELVRIFKNLLSGQRIRPLSSNQHTMGLLPTIATNAC